MFCKKKKKKNFPRTFLVVQWLRLQIPNAGGLGWEIDFPWGQGNRSHKPQLKMLRTATKTPHSQIKINK